MASKKQNSNFHNCNKGYKVVHKAVYKLGYNKGYSWCIIVPIYTPILPILLMHQFYKIVFKNASPLGFMIEVWVKNRVQQGFFGSKTP